MNNWGPSFGKGTVRGSLCLPKIWVEKHFEGTEGKQTGDTKAVGKKAYNASQKDGERPDDRQCKSEIHRKVEYKH